ncbi:hypothetical protein [Cryobacterium frigoriphilum]|uniref:hypothetical protein n=1 Tax=Cryobacterium frigoriphilum TaxID=1259150 RepID=UPI001F545441|nr:hypothetical protein [Cryobacterium frigoriphilum]
MSAERTSRPFLRKWAASHVDINIRLLADNRMNGADGGEIIWLGDPASVAKR